MIEKPPACEDTGRGLFACRKQGYIEIQPSALATELARMIAAKMGQRYRSIKLNTGLRRKG